MALKVRTAHGKEFFRCGIEFGPDWKVVDGDKLAEKFGTPMPAADDKAALAKLPIVEQVLRGEKMLVCEPASEPDKKGAKS